MLKKRDEAEVQERITGKQWGGQGENLHVLEEIPSECWGLLESNLTQEIKIAQRERKQDKQMAMTPGERISWMKYIDFRIQ
jgi:hypothetical protein